MEPFDSSSGGVEVTIEFAVVEGGGSEGGVVRYTLPVALPVSVLHFVWGLKMSKSDFLSYWQEMTVPEVTDSFSFANEGEGGREEGLVALLTKQFHLELVQELCVKVEDVQTWTLAGSLETGSLFPQGKQLRVGALIRLEIGGGGGREGGRKGYRLTVRSVHPTCAKAIFKAMKDQLGG